MGESKNWTNRRTIFMDGQNYIKTAICNLQKIEWTLLFRIDACDTPKTFIATKTFLSYTPVDATAGFDSFHTNTIQIVSLRCMVVLA